AWPPRGSGPGGESRVVSRGSPVRPVPAAGGWGVATGLGLAVEAGLDAVEDGLDAEQEQAVEVVVLQLGVAGQRRVAPGMGGDELAGLPAEFGLGGRVADLSAPGGLGRDEALHVE